jgi:hypothetical protein
LSGAIEKAARSEQFNNTLANVGLEGGFLNIADFAKFWEVDAKRSEEAVALIGKVQG